MPVDPHDYPAAHRAAEQQRQQVQDDFWRGADAVWAHALQDTQRRLARSTTRLQSALKRRQRPPAKACG